MKASVFLFLLCTSTVTLAQPKPPKPNTAQSKIIQAQKKLFDAIKYNNLAAFETAISTKDIDLNATQSEFPLHTPLLEAIDKNRPEMTKLLLAQPSVDVNRPSGTKYTFPLHGAGISSPKLVAMLLAHPKIDPNLKPASDSYPALFTVLSYCDLSMVKLFLNHPKTDLTITDAEGQTAIFPAVQTNRWDLIPTLLATNKFDVNLKNTRGNTILHEVIRSNNPERIRSAALLPNIDPHLPNAKGETPLTLAIQKSLSAVNALLENKATQITPANQAAIDLLNKPLP